MTYDAVINLRSESKEPDCGKLANDYRSRAYAHEGLSESNRALEDRRMAYATALSTQSGDKHCKSDSAPAVSLAIIAKSAMELAETLKRRHDQEAVKVIDDAWNWANRSKGDSLVFDQRMLLGNINLDRERLHRTFRYLVSDDSKRSRNEEIIKASCQEGWDVLTALYSLDRSAEDVRHSLEAISNDCGKGAVAVR